MIVIIEATLFSGLVCRREFKFLENETIGEAYRVMAIHMETAFTNDPVVKLEWVNAR